MRVVFGYGNVSGRFVVGRERVLITYYSELRLITVNDVDDLDDTSEKNRNKQAAHYALGSAVHSGKANS